MQSKGRLFIYFLFFYWKGMGDGGVAVGGFGRAFFLLSSTDALTTLSIWFLIWLSWRSCASSSSSSSSSLKGAMSYSCWSILASFHSLSGSSGLSTSFFSDHGPMQLLFILFFPSFFLSFFFFFFSFFPSLSFFFSNCHCHRPLASTKDLYPKRLLPPLVSASRFSGRSTVLSWPCAADRTLKSNYKILEQKNDT